MTNSKSMSKSTSMSKQNSGPNPWAVGTITAVGTGLLTAAGVGIYHRVHGKNLANNENIAMGEEMIRLMQQNAAGGQG